MAFLQRHPTSCLLGLGVLFSTLFPNTHKLCSSVTAKDQVSHPYEATDKMIILEILILTLYSRDDKTT
jgi:hypothetical protein